MKPSVYVDLSEGNEYWMLKATTILHSWMDDSGTGLCNKHLGPIVKYRLHHKLISVLVVILTQQVTDMNVWEFGVWSRINVKKYVSPSKKNMSVDSNVSSSSLRGKLITLLSLIACLVSGRL
mmetsp:Transcript_7616/g.12318  ORF Transcript_7616/g.12318 Transcript_7616/m.12318 type:complete len:122 (-) Transcript_7616:801-1166(-)